MVLLPRYVQFVLHVYVYMYIPYVENFLHSKPDWSQRHFSTSRWKMAVANNVFQTRQVNFFGGWVHWSTCETKLQCFQLLILATECTVSLFLPPSPSLSLSLSLYMCVLSTNLNDGSCGQEEEHGNCHSSWHYHKPSPHLERSKSKQPIITPIKNVYRSVSTVQLLKTALVWKEGGREREGHTQRGRPISEQV